MNTRLVGFSQDFEGYYKGLSESPSAPLTSLFQVCNQKSSISLEELYDKIVKTGNPAVADLFRRHFSIQLKVGKNIYIITEHLLQSRAPAVLCYNKIETNMIDLQELLNNFLKKVNPEENIEEAAQIFVKYLLIGELDPNWKENQPFVFLAYQLNLKEMMYQFKISYKTIATLLKYTIDVKDFVLMHKIWPFLLTVSR